MAQIISLNADAPALKTKGPRAWDLMYEVRISGEYIIFAGQREFRAWRVTAYNGFSTYSREFTTNAALLALISDEMGFYPEDSREMLAAAEHGEIVKIPYCLMEEDLQDFGFKEPKKSRRKKEP